MRLRLRFVKSVEMKVTLLALLCPLIALGYNNPPYEVYPYLADDTDDPPLNYMKVCEPGDVGEDKASYVVLGINFPISRQAVAPAYDGDLVVPSVIDGLPVRKIIPYAFSTCQKLRSVHVPSSVLEVGDHAFNWCTSLTNVTFEEGVSLIGDCAFTNCLALERITLPRSLKRIGRGCFAWCNALEEIHFCGNAPQVDCRGVAGAYFGEKYYNSAAPFSRPTVRVYADSVGWNWFGMSGIPDRWPLECGFQQSYKVVVENRPGSAKDWGFVSVVTEVEGGAVAVPESWSARYPKYTSMFGTNFAKSVCAETGKTGADGKAMYVWQDYVAGTDPTDVSDRFTALITMEDGEPKIEYRPVLSQAEQAKRVYSIYGRKSLWGEDWIVLQPQDIKNYNFFKVTVRMR